MEVKLVAIEPEFAIRIKQPQPPSFFVNTSFKLYSVVSIQHKIDLKASHSDYLFNDLKVSRKNILIFRGGHKDSVGGVNNLNLAREARRIFFTPP